MSADLRARLALEDVLFDLSCQFEAVAEGNEGKRRAMIRALVAELGTDAPPPRAALAMAPVVAITDLTNVQRRILDEIRRSIRKWGYPPTIRELGEAVGLTSTSSVAAHIRTLERKGHLQRGTPNRPRTLTLVDGSR